MSSTRRRALALGCVLLLALQLAPAAAQGIAEQQTLREAREALADSLKQVNEVGGRLAGMAHVHGIAKQYVNPSTPKAFVAGLELERNLVSELVKQNDLLGKVVVVANRVAQKDGVNTTAAEVRENLQLIDDGLRTLQGVLAEHAQPRAQFKTRLGQFADGMPGASDGNRGAVRMVLDPAILDAQVRQQRSIVKAAAAELARLQ